MKDGVMGYYRRKKRDCKNECLTPAWVNSHAGVNPNVS